MNKKYINSLTIYSLSHEEIIARTPIKQFFPSKKFLYQAQIQQTFTEHLAYIWHCFSIQR